MLKRNLRLTRNWDCFTVKVGMKGDYNALKQWERKKVSWRTRLLIQGKRYPCFIFWSSKRSMASQAVREVVEELDAMSVPFRKGENVIPFLLFDGHGSQVGTGCWSRTSVWCHILAGRILKRA